MVLFLWPGTGVYLVCRKGHQGLELEDHFRFICGAALAFYITVATPAETPSNWLFIFLCGAIAICAMILPGISGSFILVLLGKYFFIMDAVKTLDLVVIGIFGAGACIGITSFSRYCRLPSSISAILHWPYLPVSCWVL